MRTKKENYVKNLSSLQNYFGGHFDIEASTERLNALEELTADPSLWNHQANAQKLLREKSNLEEKPNAFNKLKSNLKNA